MKTKKILNKFKNAHPELIKLNPEIRISEIIESFDSISNELIIHNPPKLTIEVVHPFIFDNSLVPKEFEGIEVRNVQIGEFPEESVS